MIFSEIRADHTAYGLKMDFRPKPIWELYVEAVLARQKQGHARSGGSSISREVKRESFLRWCRMMSSALSDLKRSERACGICPCVPENQEYT